MNRNRERSVLFLLFWLLLSAGVVLRFYDLDRRPVWYDEAHTLLWLSGRTMTELTEVVSDRPVSAAELLVFQRVDPNRGVVATVRALAREDSQHVPLYFVAARMWAGLFGSSIASVRSLSGVFGLLLLPGVFLLGRELFSGRRAARLATLLVALSPYHVFYSREARPYSLLAAMAAWSSFLLLRSHRRGGAWNWALYTVSVVAGLYTHLFFSLVLLAHVLWLVAESVGGDVEPRRARRTRPRFVAAALVGGLAILPWIVVLVGNLTTAGERLAWMEASSNRLHLVGMWAFNYSSAFLDVGDVGAFARGLDSTVVLVYIGRGIVLILAGCALVHIARSRIDLGSRVLVLALILLPFVALAAPDLLLGETRSGYAPRHLGVSFLGLELALAAFLAWFVSQRGWRRRLSSLVTLGLLAGSAFSSALVSSSEFWWYAPERDYARATAAVVNSASRPVVLQEIHGRMLMLAHYYDTDTILWCVDERVPWHLLESSEAVFVLRPLDAKLRGSPHLRLMPTRVHGLYQVEQVPTMGRAAES